MTHRADFEEFNATVEDRGTTRTISLSGGIDVGSAAALNQTLGAALWEADFETVVVDLAGVSFIGSTGLRILLDAYANSVLDGVRLVVLPGPPEVQRLFELCDATKQLPLVLERTTSTSRRTADRRRRRRRANRAEHAFLHALESNGRPGRSARVP